MGAAIVLWLRAGDAGCADALAFLRAHKYGADALRDVAREPLRAADVAALQKALGDLGRAVAWRHPAAAALLPRGPDGSGQDEVARALVEHPELLKVPVLLTPKGGVAGFGEQGWRAFLGIGRSARG